MFLKKLQLTNFRNYTDCPFQFDSRTTLLIGDNAQGKSNFLEAIYFLATAKSPRASQDIESVNTGSEVTRVTGELEGDTNLEIVMLISETGIKKVARVNGVNRRVAEYASNLAVVLFTPEDVHMVAGSPSLRRNYLDDVISQVDRAYKRALADYESVITRRNKILKKIRDYQGNPDELSYWTDQQLMLGGIITAKREQFFQFVNQVEKKLGNFQYHYICSELTPERLKEYRRKEIDSASSLIGPHRDDFSFLLDDKDLSKFGSRGEQRTAVLDLKLAEASFIEQALGERPVMLLDDIFSELDLEHREHVLEVSKFQQTIIAAIELDDHLRRYLSDDVTFFDVVNGQITLIDNKLSKQSKG